VYVNAGTNQLGGNPEHRYQIFRFDAATGAGQQITNFPKGVSNRSLAVSVSDDGQWIAFTSRADPVSQNHGDSSEIFLIHPDGSGIVQLTNDPSLSAVGMDAVVLSGSANRVVFLSRANPLGTNPSNRGQIFIVNVDGTGLKQLTSATTGGISGGSISDDGQRIGFSSSSNPTGGNADGSTEVFAIQADGTNLRQLTSSTGSPVFASQYPVLSGDGSTIAFEQVQTSGFTAIYLLNWDGTGLLPLVAGKSPSIADDGQFVFFSYGSVAGQSEIWKVKRDGSVYTQLTTPSGAQLNVPVVAGGGGRVAFAGTIPSNPNWNGSGELGVMTGSGTNSLQLLTMTTWDIQAPEITRDGTRVVFESRMNPFGTNPDAGVEIFRIQSDGTGLFQVTSIPSGDASSPSIAADDNTIVFSSDADIAGQNPSGNL